MSVHFQWKGIYSVGERLLDDQHRYLFDLGNEIQMADSERVKYYIMKLYQYATAHFDEEEKHMKAIGYPNVGPHTELHNQLISNLNKFSAEFKSRSLSEFTTFLHTWLIRHVLLEDKKYFDYAQCRQIAHES